MKIKNRRTFLILIILYAVLTVFSQSHAFFGDMVQFGSRHSHFFYENNLSTFWLPNELDSGHPPVFGFYIATIWSIFGKSLIVSHWAMFPFLCIIAFSITQLLSLFVPQKWVLPSALIFFIEPTLLSQSSLTSPDIVLISFFLLSLWLFLKGKNIALSISLLCMAIISTRGMMVLFSFFIAINFLHILIEKKLFHSKWKSFVLTFILPIFTCVLWLFIHYKKTGWIGFHSDSPWATSFESVGIFQMIKNLGLMIWRWIDFGRIVMWLVLFLLIIKYYKSFSNRNYPLLLLSFMTVSMGFVFALNTLFADGLVGHRYYMPVYLTSLLICYSLLNINIEKTKRSAVYLGLIGLGFFIGGRYIYPPKIAMGWDATPAHWPYYETRDQMMDYMVKQNIPLHETGAGFPSIDSREYLELNGDTSTLSSYASSDIKYILWSNIFNYPDELIDKIEKDSLVYSVEKKGVFMSLYKIKN